MRRGGTGGVAGALLAMSSSSLAVRGAVSISSIVFVGFGRPFVDERVVVVGDGGGGLDADDGGDGND